jgi:hypothetical protein
MSKFRIINRATREEQIFNSKELRRFFYCEFDHKTGKPKYNLNDMNDYAISYVKPKSESLLEALGFGFLGLAIVILATKIIMSWI